MKFRSLGLVAAAIAVLLSAPALLAQAEDSPLRTRPVEGWGPYRLGQAIPRMQMGKFLPVHDIPEISAPSFEERFEAGSLLRTYRCVDELKVGRKEQVLAVYTISTVDGDVQSIAVQTDFTLVGEATAGEAKPDAALPGGAAPDWDARKEQASQAYRWLLDENFQHYLGHRANSADVEQVIDGAGPCFVSTIAPVEGAGALVLMLYPQHPLLLVQVNTELWRSLAKEEASPAEPAQPAPYASAGG